MPQGIRKTISIDATPDRIHVRGDVQQDLRMAVEAPLRSLPLQPTGRGMDLLTIAAGVYAVDRAVKRRVSDGNETGIRSLNLRFAVRDLGFWQRTEITNTVTQILCFLTDENWSLTFERATTELMPREVQSRMTVPWHWKPGRIALYSGGLDSAAGLANRVLAGAKDYLLVTVGHHSRMHRQCTDQIQGGFKSQAQHQGQ